MVDILNLAPPYFGLIFIGFACGKAKPLPEQGLAWMNFFLLYVSLPALLFGIMSKTPFAELNNPLFLIATTLGTASAFALALVAGRLVGPLSFREGTLAGLAGGFGVFVIAGQHDTWIEPASVAVLIGTFASVITLTSVMWFIQTGLLVFP
jgi:malonate transporter and related proteins